MLRSLHFWPHGIYVLVSTGQSLGSRFRDPMQLLALSVELKVYVLV